MACNFHLLSREINWAEILRCLNIDPNERIELSRFQNSHNSYDDKSQYFLNIAVTVIFALNLFLALAISREFLLIGNQLIHLNGVLNLFKIKEFNLLSYIRKHKFKGPLPKFERNEVKNLQPIEDDHIEVLTNDDFDCNRIENV